MDNQLSQVWLDSICRLTPEAQAAIVLLPSRQGGKLSLSAKWPPKFERYEKLTPLVNYCLKKTTPLYIPKSRAKHDNMGGFFAIPIPSPGGQRGALIVKVGPLSTQRQSILLKTLQSSVQYLHHAYTGIDKDERFYSRILGVLVTCLDQSTYHELVLKLVAELSAQYQCERVALAEYKHQHCQVLALSNSAEFDQRTNLITMIADAMDEAIEQDTVLVFPQAGATVIQRAHQGLARKFGVGSLCTIPLAYEGEFYGAVTLLIHEENPIAHETLDLCCQTLALLTPFLVLKRERERPLSTKLWGAFCKQVKTLFGLRFLGIKLASAFAIILILITTQIDAEYQVSADAILEGKVQRVIAAPISGYLLTASARAGDMVSAGEELASLNDNDLRLEQTKLNGQLQKLQRQYRQAQSTRDLVQVNVIREQINQAKAEIELNSEQLDKTKLLAPFDGVVIEGDLNQRLGSPVERGDSLFKIAPLEGYRIILKVDETQIAYIKPGQSGELVLSSLPNNTLQLGVKTITAVAKADNGANIFRVEAELNNAPELLRPGMQGVGRINTGKASLWWIYTHNIQNTLRLWLWSWLP
ncbi:MAG: RND family efflux transporter MFP subunit [Pseudohongiellaceae bacterium]|jgi:RND family efflux transporter MFP subunit